MMPTVEIVIVNWNSGVQLKECLVSIKKTNKSNFILNKVVVVDNASTDDSLETIDTSSHMIKIIKNNENIGFGKACNKGAENTKSDFILFLNPDMIVFEDTFLNLFNYINKNDSSDIGVYGIQLLDSKNNIQKSCARIPNLWNMIVRSTGLNKLNNKIFKTYALDDWEHNTTKDVEHIMGAFYLIRTDLFHELDGFDERYFVYIEDLDLSKRVLDSGYKLRYVTEAQAYHKGGGTSEQVKAKRLFYSTRSRLIYAFKHFGIFQGIIIMLFTFLVEPIARIMFLLLKSNLGEIKEMLKGFGMLYKDTFNIFKKGLQK